MNTLPDQVMLKWIGQTLRRSAKPEEIANAVAFLASPRAAYISGTILTIDDPARMPS